MLLPRVLTEPRLRWPQEVLRRVGTDRHFGSMAWFSTIEEQGHEQFSAVGGGE